MKFNFEITVDIEVETDGDEKLIRFDNDSTVGLNPTTHGFTITPDWTNRRFTMAFPGDSSFYHVTEEGKTETKRNEGRHLSHEAVVADVYSGLRSIGPVFPADRLADLLNIEWLYIWDLDGIREYFDREGVIESMSEKLRVNSDEVANLISVISTDPDEYDEWTNHTLSRVSLAEAVDSSRSAFLSPSLDHLVIIYPDEYACLVAMEDLADVVFHLKGSLVWDALRDALIENNDD